MRKFAVLGMGVCMVWMFSSCKSSESAYKKAYEKAKEQELVEPQEPARVVETTPVVTAPVQVAPSGPINVTQEKVTVVSGADNLKDFSVVCGSFGVKANAENLKDFLTTEGYMPVIVFNADKSTYRVIVSSFSDRESAASARDTFKRRYPHRDDFQGSWLLYRIY